MRSLLIYLLAVLPLALCQRCPHGWEMYSAGDTCVVLKTDSKKNFFEAQKDCKAYDSLTDLVVIKDDNMNAWLAKLVKSVNDKFLIGLTDQGAEGKYVWVNGEDLVKQDKNPNWNVNEPNNAGEEDCAQILPNGKWNDIGCSNSFYFICQRPNDVPLACDEDNGWITGVERCLKYYSSSMTWADARQYCQDREADLIQIHSEAEQTMIPTMLVSGSWNTFWLGLTDQIKNFQGQYTWVDNSDLGTLTYWASGQPDNSNFNNGGNCVEILNNPADGKWTTTSCTQKRSFVCEKEKGTCAPGWRIHGGQCYNIYTNSPMTWPVAKATCEAHRAFLTSVRSADENVFIVKQLIELDQLNIDRVWMGVSDSKTDGVFEWADGTSIAQYTNWQPNGPSDRTGYTDCGFYSTSDAQGKWNTGNCYEVFSFICKIKAGEKVYPLDPTNAVGTCQAGWNLFNNSCYYIETTKDTYDVGKKACEDKQSTLTSILDSEEQSYLSMRTYMLKQYLWIGLNDKQTSNVFEWEDGSPYDFKYWAPGQPDHFGTGDTERCVHFRYGELEEGMWNDLPCSNKMCGYICKKPAGAGTLPTFKPPPTPIFNDRCGTGWEYDPTSKQCYLFKPGDLTDWQSARKICQLGGGDIVSITALAEQTYINARLALNTETSVWIGANDLSSEGGWEWSNGDPFKFLNWASGEPNNWGALGEHCSELKILSGQWNDVACSNTMGYVCKKSGYLVSHFSAYPNRYLAVTAVAILPNEFPDVCAYACVITTVPYKCLAFNYDRITKECSLLDSSKDTAGGLKTDADKDYYQLRNDAPTPTVKPTLGPTYRCPDKWQGNGDYCYQSQPSLKTWADALTDCRTKSADLASIWDTAENAFITQVISQDTKPGEDGHFWMGLNDNKVSMTYEWSDDSAVTFTNWGKGEPNNYNGNPEDCGEVQTNGYWNDEDCSSLRQYICKMKKQDLGPTQFPVTPSGCEQGWIPYGQSCYKVADETRETRDDALAKCQAYGGGLVIITDNYEQSVITTQLGQQAWYNHFWLGLHDRNVKGYYEWEDGETFSYDNWGQAQPDESKGRCVYATSGTASGLWYVGSCNTSDYYICEKTRGGFSTIKVTQGTQTTPTNNDCAPDWIGYGSHCIKAFNLKPKLDFWSAETFCANMGGHLASFHSKGEEDHFVAQTILAIGKTDDAYWIGFHDSTAEGAFEWLDQSLVQWTNWHQNPKEPNNAGDGEDCTEMFFNEHGWNDIPCKGFKRNAVCLLPKGQMPATTLPPVTYPRCPTDDGFISFNTYCYYLSPSGTMLGWAEAEDFCHTLGADLASIHGQDEQDFLFDLISGENRGDFWIGLREFGKNGIYRWADNTSLDYDAWGTGEPNDYNGEEECVEMYPQKSDTGGNWNDQNCGTPRNFICKKHESAVGPVTHAPTPPPTGYCAPDSVRFLNRCYTLYGAKPEDRLPWRNASLECKKFPGGELATIHSQAVQAKITSFLENYKFHVWIGLSDITTNRQFKWIDGTTVDYTNWNTGEPNEAGGEEDCVEMYAHWNDAGEWNDNNCENLNGYMCKSKPDDKYNPPQLPLNPCGTGWTYWPNARSCFKILPDLIPFSEATTACKAQGNQATLASLNTPYEAAFADGLMVEAAANPDGSVTEEKPLWIGMSDQQTTGEYSWQDNWPVFYTRWDTSEPSKGAGEGCVVMDFNGRWNDTLCSNRFGSLCKFSLDSPPTHPPDLPGTCDDGWLPYGSYCMYFQPADQDPVTEYQAERTCNDFGGNLVTIHHMLENKMVSETMRGIRSESAWLGLYRSDVGSFEWLDSQPVDYVNWATNEPTMTWNGEHENCVEMYTQSGEWNDNDCNQLRTFICKKLKSQNTTDSPNPPPTPEKVSGGLSTGAVVGIVLGTLVAVLLVLLGVFFVYSRNRSPKGPANVADLPTSGFDNMVYDSSGEVKYAEPSAIGQQPADASSA